MQTALTEFATLFARTATAVPAEQLTAATPCADFTVADLFSHLGGVLPDSERAARKLPRAAEPVAALTEPAAVAACAERAAAAWREPDALADTTEFGPGAMPAAFAAAITLQELALHGWDLARATGRRTRSARRPVPPCWARWSSWPSRPAPPAATGRRSPLPPTPQPLSARWPPVGAILAGTAEVRSTPMSEIAFEVDIDADRAAVLQALNSHDGLTAWWTTGVDRKEEILFFDFPGVPQPFELRRDSASEDLVAWTSVGVFPPHWAGTTLTWQLTELAEAGGTRLLFRHAGWQDGDPGLPPAAYTWGQLLTRLKEYAETGTRAPLFTV